MKKILMIIPAYNEEKNILDTVNMINNYKDLKLDYVVINDGSIDNTLNVLKNNNIDYINLSNNLGIGAAVQTGYKYAHLNDYDIAIQFDGDGQHDINYVYKLVKEIEKGSDLVIGSRFSDQKSDFLSTRSRRLGIKIISFFIKLFSKKKILDVTSGYRASNKKVIEYFSKHYPFDYPEPITNLELLKKGYKISEVAVNMRERKYGKSSINLKKSIGYMINVVISLFVTNFSRKEK